MSSADATPAVAAAAAPATLREVRTPMGVWSYAIHGERRRPADPDVLLLGGLFLDAATLWRAQTGPLARLGRVVALDMPGHGRSDVPPPFDLPTHAETLAGALPSMGISRAICVGWSWGGALALHLALRDPARVAGLAVIEASAEAQPAARRLQYRLLLAIVRWFGMVEALARGPIAPIMFSPRTLRERPELVDEFARRAAALPREALLRGARAVAVEPPSILERLPGVRTPALVVCGRRSRGYAPGVGERMARAIPGARLEWIEDAGHLCVLEQPEEVNRRVVPFVAGILS